MDLEGSDRGLFEILSRHLRGQSEEKHGKPVMITVFFLPLSLTLEHTADFSVS
jgi:hypothetical protein